MAKFGFTVVGEAHGAGLVGIITGLPRGIPFSLPKLNRLLLLRRSFAGRGARSALEDQPVEWLAGVDQDQKSNGGPVAFLLRNSDHTGQHSDPGGVAVKLEFPRPGHADAAGAARWGLTDASPVAELASGRLTAAYCVAGHICQGVLDLIGISTLAHVLQLGLVRSRSHSWIGRPNLSQWQPIAQASPCLALDPVQGQAMEEAIRQALESGDTLGGKAEVIASPLPAGLGCPQPIGQRLDARLAALLMGLPGVKAMEIGDAVQSANRSGSQFHDAFTAKGGRRSNRAGGLEGGMTNGQPLVVRVWVKPVPTLQRPLDSVSLADGRLGSAARVRSDITAVAPTALAAEAMVRLALAETILDDSAGRTLDELRRLVQ